MKNLTLTAEQLAAVQLAIETRIGFLATMAVKESRPYWREALAVAQSVRDLAAA